MLEWIKLEINILADKRIQAMIADYGLAALGTYVLLRIHLDAHSGHGLPLDYVLNIGAPITRKKKTLSIVRNYGLFTEDDFGNVRACALAPALGTPAPGTPAPVSSALEPTKDENILETDKSVIIKKRFKKPTVDEVDEYCRQRQNNICASHFCDYYESIGWTVGKAKMVDWKAAVRTWERKNTNRNVTTELKQPVKTFVQPDGVQYYNGRPLPHDAPPRPSDIAEWDEASQSWFELYR